MNNANVGISRGNPQQLPGAPGHSPAPAAAPASAAAPINILIVDDEPKNLTVLETVLTDPRYRLIRAESADQALLSLMAEDFALLILDIQMPGMSGFELAHMIKERRKTAKVPIIFLTAYYNEDQHIIEGYDTGAVDYLQKPVNASILRSKVAVFAELHLKSRELMIANRSLSTEVAERRQAEEQLRELNSTLERRISERTALLEAANLAKDQFLAALSHELRTPLTPVRMAVSVWERCGGALPPHFHSDLAMIRRNIDLECRLIDDMLDLNRIAHGKLELQFAAVDLNEEARHAVMSVESDAVSKKIALTFEPSAHQMHVLGDAARLQQILWNLLKNAVKFTPTGGSISVRTYNHSASSVSVEVCDTGIGIEPSEIKRIFHSFEQGSMKVTRQFGGLGLGLSISKALCDMHGGTLTASSAGSGQGATFLLTLQVAPSASAAAENQPEAADAALEPSPAATDRKVRLLLVEDHPDTSRIMNRLLLSLGYDVHLSSSVAEAVAAADRHEFELVLSDIGLPDGTGYELMRQLLARGIARGIALSGYGMEDDIRRGTAAGFAAYLTKPVNIEQLETTIKRVLDAPANILN